MNTSKLNELAAQAMGWTKVANIPPNFVSSVWDMKGGKVVIPGDWNPCEDLNDASALLEKVALKINDGWMVDCRPHETPKMYFCWFGPWDQEEFLASGETEALAKTLCALRASGIPESSITEAMKP